MRYFYSILVATLFTSCATYNINPVTTLATDENGNVQVVAGNQQKLRFINIIRTFKETLNGRLLAKAEVQNRSTKPKVFMYKFDWLDENGNIASEASKWKTATINGQEVKTLEDIDVRGGAVDFHVLLKSK